MRRHKLAPAEPDASGIRTMVVKTFVGEGDLIEQAVEDATAQLNAYLATRQWLDESGRPLHRISHGAAYVELQQFGEVIHYVISAFGPAEEVEAAGV